MLALRIRILWLCELLSLSRGTIAVPDQECFTPCMPFPPFHPSHRSSYQFLHAILSHRAWITILRPDSDWTPISVIFDFSKLRRLSPIIFVIFINMESLIETACWSSILQLASHKFGCQYLCWHKYFPWGSRQGLEATVTGGGLLEV